MAGNQPRQARMSASNALRAAVAAIAKHTGAAASSTHDGAGGAAKRRELLAAADALQAALDRDPDGREKLPGDQLLLLADMAAGGDLEAAAHAAGALNIIVYTSGPRSAEIPAAAIYKLLDGAAAPLRGAREGPFGVSFARELPRLLQEVSESALCPPLPLNLVDALADAFVAHAARPSPPARAPETPFGRSSPTPADALGECLSGACMNEARVSGHVARSHWRAVAAAADAIAAGRCAWPEGAGRVLNIMSIDDPLRVADALEARPAALRMLAPVCGLGIPDSARAPDLLRRLWGRGRCAAAARDPELLRALAAMLAPGRSLLLERIGAARALREAGKLSAAAARGVTEAPGVLAGLASCLGTADGRGGPEDALATHAAGALVFLCSRQAQTDQPNSQGASAAASITKEVLSSRAAVRGLRALLQTRLVAMPPGECSVRTAADVCHNCLADDASTLMSIIGLGLAAGFAGGVPGPAVQAALASLAPGVEAAIRENRRTRRAAAASGLCAAMASALNQCGDGFAAAVARAAPGLAAALRDTHGDIGRGWSPAPGDEARGLRGIERLEAAAQRAPPSDARGARPADAPAASGLPGSGGAAAPAGGAAAGQRRGSGLRGGFLAADRRARPAAAQHQQQRQQPQPAQHPPPLAQQQPPQQQPPRQAAASGSGAAAAAAARSTCAQCGAAAAPGQKLKWCQGCRTVKYCCPEHQRAHWQAHKPACRAAAAAAAAAAEAPSARPAASGEADS